MTSSDAVVTPWQSQLPAGPADRVRSVVVDQQCPGLVVRHEDMARTPAVVGWVVAALDTGGAVDPAALRCGSTWRACRAGRGRAVTATI